MKNTKRLYLTKSNKMSQIHTNGKNEQKEQVRLLGVMETDLIFEDI